MTKYLLYPPGTSLMSIIDLFSDYEIAEEGQCYYHGFVKTISWEIEINGGYSDFIVVCKECLQDIIRKLDEY